jgi:chromosome segregation ATPase
MKSGDSARGSESRVTSTEDKLKALEQVVGLHAFLLEAQANSLAELSEDMTVADADLQAQIIAAIESADAALSAQNAVLQAELDSLSAALLAQGSDIAAINAHLVTVDKKIKRLKKASKLHKHQIAHLKQRLNWEIAKRKMKDNYLKGLILALDNELSSVESNLQGQINSLSSDLDSVESALGSISDVQAAIDSAISAYEAGDQECTVGTQSVSITVPYQYDGDCGYGNSECEEDDFDYSRVITFTVPSVSCT